MLSLEKCRKIIGESASLTDSELEVLRDQVNELATVMIDVLIHERGKQAEFNDVLQLVHVDRRYDVEERAAILEYEAGMVREDAERLALHNFIEVSSKDR